MLNHVGPTVLLFFEEFTDPREGSPYTVAAADLSHFYMSVCVCCLKVNESVCVWVSICVKATHTHTQKYASIHLRDKYAAASVSYF